MNPWESEMGRNIWRTENEFWTWVRGGMRSGFWNRNPLKFDFIKKKRKLVRNPKLDKNPKSKPQVWGAECEICNEDFVLKEIQVDHINPVGSIKSLDDLPEAFRNMVMITEDDLRILCRECHATVSHGQRYGLDLKEAAIRRTAIRWMRITPLDEQKSFLSALGEKHDNKTQRRDAYEKYLRGQKYFSAM